MIRYEKFTDSIDEPAEPAAKPNKPSEDQEGKKLSYKEALCNTSLELLLLELSSIDNLVIHRYLGHPVDDHALPMLWALMRTQKVT